MSGLIAFMKRRINRWLGENPEILDELTVKLAGERTGDRVIRRMSLNDAWHMFAGSDRMEFVHWLAKGDPDFVSRCATSDDPVFISLPREQDESGDNTYFTDRCYAVSPAEALQDPEILDTHIRELTEQRRELVREIAGWIAVSQSAMDQYSERLARIDYQLSRARESGTAAKTGQGVAPYLEAAGGDSWC